MMTGQVYKLNFSKEVYHNGIHTTVMVMGNNELEVKILSQEGTLVTFENAAMAIDDALLLAEAFLTGRRVALSFNGTTIKSVELV